jgi:hypothetical protein
MPSMQVSTFTLADRVEQSPRILARGSPPNNGTARCHVQGVIGPQTGNGVPARPIER